MKTTIQLSIGLAMTALAFLSSCSYNPKGDKATVADSTEVLTSKGLRLNIDTGSSRIGFTGYGVGKDHPGYFKITSGNIVVDEGEIKGGNFTINTKSLVLNQQDAMFQTKLRGHLLGPDFFNADLFPTAKFEITAVEPYSPAGQDTSVVKGANYKISGNLTLKDVTKNVTFPAKIDLTADSFVALANFNINRNLWDMKYGTDKSIKDGFISETVNIAFDIKSN